MKLDTGTVCRSLCILALAFSSSICQAQQQDSDSPIRIYAIEHSVAQEIYHVLATAFEGKDDIRLSVDNNTNSLVLMAGNEDHKRAANIIDEIDRPPKQPGVKVFALRHGDCVALAETLARLLERNQNTVRLSFDQKSNSLIVLGSDSELERAEALIQRLDQPSASMPSVQGCKVRVTWLTDAGPLSPEQIEDLGTPNENLKDLIKGLKDEMMDDVKTVSVCTTRVGLSNNQTRKRFRNTGFRTVGGQTYSMAITGQIEGQSNGKYELDIAVKMVGGPQQLEHASVFALPANHPVALSVSDFGDLKAVMVIEVIDLQN